MKQFGIYIHRRVDPYKTELRKIFLTKSPVFLDKKYSIENLLGTFFFAWNTEGLGDVGAKQPIFLNTARSPATPPD